ncbi:MAG: cell division protein FtsQ [Bacteroidetes bacterium]|nr:cell division protein FtsQ [Bacteroidota bacterium]
MNRAETIKTLKRLGWVALFFLTAILIISAVEKKKSSHASEVNIQINPLQDGFYLVDESDILLTIERSFGYDLTGIPMGAINVERLERVLEDDPFVLNADAYIDARNKVNIEVWQREPVLRIIDNNGLNYYLDEHGVKLPLSKHFTARVLVVTGNIPPHVPDYLEREQHSLKDIFDLTKKIRSDDFFKPLIEQVYIGNTGEFTLVPKVGNQKILLGDYTSIESKLRRLKIFYKEGMPYKGWQTYKTINLKFKEQVVCEK